MTQQKAKGLVASATQEIDAPREEVWEALTDPAKISKYMFGAKVKTDWKEGSPITWNGEWEGKPYQDKGELLQVDEPRVLKYSHFSPLSKLPDKPENYHTVTISLTGDEDSTTVELEQDGNPSPEARDHSQQNWQKMLGQLKGVVEAGAR